MFVTIDYPKDGQNVGHDVKVCGRVKGRKTYVQVLVYSADKLWYQQKLAKKHGHRWSCEVKVGDDVAGAKDYMVTVLAGKDRIDGAAPVEQLPEGYLSQTVTVSRA